VKDPITHITAVLLGAIIGVILGRFATPTGDTDVKQLQYHCVQAGCGFYEYGPQTEWQMRFRLTTNWTHTPQPHPTPPPFPGGAR
jgi:hypothetical protein